MPPPPLSRRTASCRPATPPKASSSPTLRARSWNGPPATSNTSASTRARACSTVPAARPRCRAGRGALQVAAGHGRGAAGRTYDWDRIDRARDQAFALLAATLTGHPVGADDPAAKALRRETIDRWSAEPGRTAADAAHAFRTAAARAEHALS